MFSCNFTSFPNFESFIIFPALAVSCPGKLFFYTLASYTKDPLVSNIGKLCVLLADDFWKTPLRVIASCVFIARVIAHQDATRWGLGHKFGVEPCPTLLFFVRKGKRLGEKCNTRWMNVYQREPWGMHTKHSQIHSCIGKCRRESEREEAKERWDREHVRFRLYDKKREYIEKTLKKSNIFYY